MAKKTGKGAIGKEFNQALADEILERLGKCERIEDICKDEHMPKVRALWGWSQTNPEWGEKFKIAKRSQRRKTFPGEASSFSSRRDIGRPTLFRPEIVERILNRLEDGENLPLICASPGMPRVRTVYDWADNNSDFSQKLARAMSILAEKYASETIEISDDQSGDWVWKQNRDGSDYSAFDHEHVQRSKLRIETRKWYASILDPRFREKAQTQQVAVVQVAQQQTITQEPQNAVEAYEAFQKLVKGE